MDRHYLRLLQPQNSLSGPLPSLSDLSNLQTAYFGRNNFTSIPSAAFFGLTSLQKLSLFNNPSLPPWPFPTDLTQSSTLSDLDFGSSGITGDLPDIFDSFLSLQNLRLSYNNLTGALPKSLASSSIINLWLNNQQNSLSGTIELSQLWLHKNQFTGGIPDLSKCDSLFDLQPRDNKLTGVVPSSLMALPNLKNVSLDNNELQGPVPAFGKGVQDSDSSFQPISSSWRNRKADLNS
ncbi:hypothetical protein Ahy_B04g069293 [Arachis hypogaea]|uniref:Leucine-rich repeat-containing N-terminal plant-type domain-containing protein n=1 Tax=Arachis hypogaea TaxID=3818 RepID=A0A444ZC98_ARAHY|nr:hypothetical protein Ahy_B04g069293 [Arachis hypogaea]